MHPSVETIAENPCAAHPPLLSVTMSLRALLATALTLPILSVLSHNILNPSLVFYFDQLPSEAYEGDPDITANKDIIYIRKDINYFDPQDGPSLACLPNGQVTLGFTNQSALELNELAHEQFLGHPVIIPHGYDMSACPDIANHTIFGPRMYVPSEALEDLEMEDDFAIMIALSEDDVKDEELTLSIIWVTYHELIGVIGDAPEELSWLAKGVFPWSITTATTSSSTSSRVERRGMYSGTASSIAKLFGKTAVNVATEWGIREVAGKISGKGSD